MKTSFFQKSLFFSLVLLVSASACTRAQQPYGRYDDRHDNNDRYGYNDRRDRGGYGDGYGGGYGGGYGNGRFNPEMRQRQQNMRIEQGIRSGALTRREVRHLRSLQSDTDRAIYAARANGYTSPRERAIISDLQDRIDRAITWEKRDYDRYPNRW